MKRVAVIGGGLAGLVCAHQLGKAGIPCRLIEKKEYPFHRVCGEYISNEAVPFLKANNLYPSEYHPPQISQFLLSAISGKHEIMPLDLGGFGISRYTFDDFLYKKAKENGTDFYLNEEVESVRFDKDVFLIRTSRNESEADVVVGAFGKRSRMDRALNRKFLEKKSPYVGVKYHIRCEHPNELIALHNFPGGYCGMSNIEQGKTTICYLSHRSNLTQFKSIPSMEEEVLFRNPLLRSIFKNSEFLFKKPEVINEISFVTKSPIEDHILMVGDSAGMITPLCGNGMAIAIHSAKILCELIIRYATTANLDRAWLEKSYVDAWNKHFRQRLWMGRQIQKLFGNAFASQLAVGLAINVRPVANAIIKNTHGESF